MVVVGGGGAMGVSSDDYSLGPKTTAYFSKSVCPSNFSKPIILPWCTISPLPFLPSPSVTHPWRTKTRPAFSNIAQHQQRKLSNNVWHDHLNGDSLGTPYADGFRWTWWPLQGHLFFYDPHTLFLIAWSRHWPLPSSSSWVCWTINLYDKSNHLLL